MQFWWNACTCTVCAPSPSGWMIGLRKVMLAPLGARAIEALACNGHSTKPKQAARVTYHDATPRRVGKRADRAKSGRHEPIDERAHTEWPNTRNPLN